MNNKLVTAKSIVQRIRQISTVQTALVDKLVFAIETGEDKSKILELTGVIQATAKERAVVSKFGNILLGQVFLMFKEKWTSLPTEFTQNFSGVYEYIYTTYGFGSQMADMYVEVWDAFLSGKYKYKVPSFVDVTSLSVVRLKIAASYIVAGKMNTRRWKTLSTKEGLTRSELVVKMEKGLGKPVLRTRPVKSTSAFFRQDTGDVQMYIDGKIEQVGFLNINAGNPKITEEIKRILKIAKIKRLK